ncbi:2-polyprenyl-6-methoxyphenol hydroxylase-like FAD-dependent oxidoreductase [Pseudoduganella lurida]|uniref:2-polyprenyl-6-methoxyphenol hydroxylase-like FAD-dependent oxidoreductase n=1 Tax=Pseudoduganella lurida TaxID=1036180 RepID=A0A562RB11_9BURK|nr:FAD-dependent monooxygenase [Pseudoduganella lurida]TWI66228.1 2-polyprenyl-6-methoxyphenol hydroxylase-like FAD-dependent oxidoreductase [Pseudoduganella lurida]
MENVLIAGAGPTGLALALWLTKFGIQVRIVDKSAGPGETSRAMVVQARTLELYRQLGLAGPVVAAAHLNPALNLWTRGQHRARVDLADAGAGLTPYPFIAVYPQDQHERLLIEHLAAMGVNVERNTELMAFGESKDGVAVRLKLPDGSEQAVTVAYLAGCDGARSTVRHQLGTGFEGGTYQQVFYVADVEADGLAPADELHVALDSGDFALLLPYGKEGRKRLIGTVRDERAEKADTLTFDDVRQDAIGRLGLQVHRVHWFSTYRVHHRVAEAFRRGRIFLLGDAAHIHSPAGGQGMNTGILDANNLAWKLADVIHARAPARLLDSYALERQAFARRLVATTDRVFTLATSEGHIADFIKTHILPTFVSLASSLDEARGFLFRTVSQTMLHYRDSPLSEGRAGEVHGGDRLPWVRGAAGDNFGPLDSGAWQVHVYGTATEALTAWCERHRLPLHVLAWTPAHHEAGFARDALYLLRPDGYVALADPQGAVEALERYFRSQGCVWAQPVA